MKIPFRHAGHEGKVLVRFRPSRSSVESGFDFFGKSYSRIDAAGFPTMRASVSYDGAGYRRFFGWIQFVDHDFGNGRRPASVVDVPPALIGFGVPFAALGECPVLFDSPATAPRRSGSFRAQAFLCAVSLVDRKIPIRPLAGFSWGYDIDDGLSIRPCAPKKLPLKAWRGHLPLLKRICPRWAYLSRP